VQDLQALQRATGVAGEVDVIVEGADLTDRRSSPWMRDYQAGPARALRVLADQRAAGKAELCPALSLTDLFRDQGAGATREQSAASWTPCRSTSPRP
jgi:hypothetical protein